MNIDRDKAIKILEKHDPHWDYEDMTDEELVEKIARVIGCSAEKQLQMDSCLEMTCVECWTKYLSE